MLESKIPAIIAAHYQLGYQTPELSGSWGLWEVPEHHPNQLLPNGERDIAAVYMPVIGPYDSSSPDTCEYHILLAKAAGIGAFILSGIQWFTPGPGFANFEKARLLLQTAETLDFKIALSMEESDGDRAQTLERLPAVLLQAQDFFFKSPAYLRIGGNPVLILTAAENLKRCGVKNTILPAEWNQIQKNIKMTLCLVQSDFSGLASFDFKEWNSVYPSLNLQSDENNSRELKAFWTRSRQALGKKRFAFISGLVYSGFDNRGIELAQPAVCSRQQGARYSLKWENNLQHGARMIQIHSWNQHQEGSPIEPVKEILLHRNAAAPGWGYRELITTREYAARFTGDKLWPLPSLFLPERLYRLRKTDAPRLRGDRIRLYLLEGDIEGAALGLEQAGV